MDSAIMPDSGDNSDEVCVPTESITIDGNAPQPGDTVDFAIEAKVTRSDNENTYVLPMKVNGEPVDQENNENEDDNQDDEKGNEPQFNDDGEYMA